MQTNAIGPYALGARDGWVYNEGVDFIVKLGERGQGRRFAVLEYRTDADEWPGHTHATEDEIFYVLKGALTFRCGTEEFDVNAGGFVFLPSGIEHGYKIRDGKEVHLLVVTAPAPEPDSAPGWDGFVSGIEASAAFRTAPSGLRD
jgi:quercetin dioxygenase-like cupin family protein